MLKQKRIVDDKLCASYRFMPCLVCRDTFGIVGHHIKSKGSGGHDIDENLMPLCVAHHSEVHNIGLVSFSKRYAKVRVFLKGMGWYLCQFKNKWYLSVDKLKKYGLH